MSDKRVSGQSNVHTMSTHDLLLYKSDFVLPGRSCENDENTSGLS